MTHIQNSAAGLTDGTVVTVGNSGGSSGTPFDAITAGALVAEADANAAVSHGDVMGYRVVPVASTVREGRWEFPAASEIHFRYYFIRRATPTVAHTIIQFRNASGVIADILMQTTGGGRLVVRNAVATGLYNNALSNLTQDSIYRVEVRLNPGTTTTNGRIRYALYSLDSETPITTYDSGVAVNIGTSGDGTEVRVGRPSAATTDVTTEDFDDVDIWTDADVPATMSNPWIPPNPPIYYKVWDGADWIDANVAPLVWDGAAWV